MVEPKQNNVEASMATAAAEEAPGKGSVDEIVEVQAVTESSGSLQPKSLDGPAPDIRQRFRSTEKSKLEQVVSLDSSTDGYLASKKGNCRAQSAVVTGGTMETEPGTNTHSNPSLENAERSCKSKTAEWALLVTNVILEAISAIFDQLGYALTSMVMAFLALFLSILDLILKARERGISCDGRGLLPCFYRHSSNDNRKLFASLVEYLGLAGALWQCSYTTVGYHYTHQKLDNPIKLCILPFILALCMLISKVVKSSQE